VRGHSPWTGFDRLCFAIELALERPTPRWPLWLRLRESGIDPERASAASLRAAAERALAAVRAELGCPLSPRERVGLRRALARFDPRIAPAYEHAERLGNVHHAR
jgi:hypothetical protein